VVRPTFIAISFTDINVVRSNVAARFNRIAFKYWPGVVPVSCLKRCRRREPERFTRSDSSEVDHAFVGRASMLEMTTSILRSISDEDLDAKMDLH